MESRSCLFHLMNLQGFSIVKGSHPYLPLQPHLVSLPTNPILCLGLNPCSSQHPSSLSRVLPPVWMPFLCSSSGEVLFLLQDLVPLSEAFPDLCRPSWACLAFFPSACSQYLTCYSPYSTLAEFVYRWCFSPGREGLCHLCLHSQHCAQNLAYYVRVDVVEK